MVLTVRMRGRIATCAVLLMIVALLPFLAGGAPAANRQAMLLSSDARSFDAVVASGQDSFVESVTPSWTATPDPELERALQSLAAASATGGGGGFAFPVIALTPLAMQTLSITTAVDGMGFIHPVAGSVASHFGPRVHPVLGRAMFHTGIDLMAACGTPVRAAAAGRVVVAQTSSSWGNRIILEHSPYLKTAYGHLSAFVAQEGDVVAQGEVIGLVGTTGWSTGCHLHWDVIINDQYVDPAPFLGMASTVHASVPYHPAPHVQPVEDGDVPVSAATQRPETATGTTTTPAKATSPTTKPTVPRTPTDTATGTATTDTPTGTEPGDSQPTEPTDPATDTGTETETEPDPGEAEPTETETVDPEPTDDETDDYDEWEGTPSPNPTTTVLDEDAEIIQPPDLGLTTGLRDEPTAIGPSTTGN